MIQKKYLLGIILLLFVFVTRAQTTIITTYFDKGWGMIPSKENAAYYREAFTRNDTTFVSDFYIAGNLQMTGTFSDTTCESKNGLFTYYHYNGKKRSQTFYRNNEPEGETKLWNEDGTSRVWDEVMPQYPGGVEALYTFLGKKIKYPKAARSQKIQGKVLIQFTVDRDGSVINISVKKSIHELLDNEAIRVVSKMPRWIPGKQDGKPIPVIYTIPVHFKL